MEKQEIKTKVRLAVERDPHNDDIKKVSLFGSYLSGIQKEDSDIDLLIEFNPSAKVGFFKLIGIQEGIERALGRRVDLLTPQALSKYFRSEVLKRAETVYEK